MPASSRSGRGLRGDADGLHVEPDLDLVADILAVLEAEGGNRTKTAARLAIAPATLYRKLAEYGVTAAPR